MKTPILGSSYVARSVNAADNRMVNLFPEIIPEGGKEPAFLSRCPGLTFLTTVSGSSTRGLWVVGDYLYVANGNGLYKYDSAFTQTVIGVIDFDSADLFGAQIVSMSNNETQLFVACKNASYIVNLATDVMTPMVAGVYPNFPGAGQVAYIDGYFIVNKPGTQQLYASALGDGLTWSATDVASAEGSPDNIVGILADHRELWVFGTNSTEVWYDSGGANFPLSPIQGAFSEIGCASASSIAKLDNTVFWLSSDARGHGIVYRARGYSGERISTHAVEWAIQKFGDLSKAVAYTYQQDGHAFYVLNFPGYDTTWVYDVSTQSWHERQGFNNGRTYQHRGICQAFYNNYNVIGLLAIDGFSGSLAAGDLCKFDLDQYTDNGDLSKWIRSWRALPPDGNNLKRSAHHTLQLDCESGVGLNSGQGDDPQVMLRWSDDGGHTWSNEHWASMGRIGQYGRRVIWRRLGMTMKLRDRVYEVSGTDPVKVIILGAELQSSGTNA